MSDNKTKNVSQDSRCPNPCKICCAYYSCSDRNCPSDCKKEFQPDYPNGISPMPKKVWFRILPNSKI